jgi:hypothetical protein
MMPKKIPFGQYMGPKMKPGTKASPKPPKGGKGGKKK